MSTVGAEQESRPRNYDLLLCRIIEYRYPWRTYVRARRHNYFIYMIFTGRLRTENWAQNAVINGRKQISAGAVQWPVECRRDNKSWSALWWRKRRARMFKTARIAGYKYIQSWHGLKILSISGVLKNCGGEGYGFIQRSLGWFRLYHNSSIIIIFKLLYRYHQSFERNPVFICSYWNDVWRNTFPWDAK